MHASWLRAIALALLWMGSAIAAGPVPIVVDRLDRSDAETTAAHVVAGSFDGEFAAQSYVAITPSRDHSVWYRLRLSHDWSATHSPLLGILDPQGLQVDVYIPPAYADTTSNMYTDQPEIGFSRHALAILLPATLKANMPIYLRVGPGRALPHRIEIQDLASARVADLAHARLDVLFPAIQLASLLVMLAFFLALRESMYGYFVGHVFFVVLYELYEFGLGYELPPFNLLAPLKERPTWLMAAIAAILLCQFSRRFLDLRHGAPRIDRAIAALGWPLALLGVCAAIPALSPGNWVEDALLLIFLLTAPLLLGAAVLTWHHGSRRGGFYLFAWIPGLLFVIVRVLQMVLQWPLPSWLEFALPAAFAFASIALAFGLAEHTLAIRHERDVAHRLAEHDVLTGALNRRAIQASARAAFRHARETGEPLALLFLDLDHFKNVNDSYGHRIGDRCLRAVMAPITSELRRDDALGRYGGEEFLIVLPRTTADDAEVIAERIRSRVQEVPMHVSGTRIGLTVSVGVAAIDTDVLTVEDLIECADAALYRAKSNGRNLVRTHPGSADASAQAAQR
jgi:diguanylate cyclase (GGDEF)-like protein